MAKARAIVKRRKAVRNIKKITKTMQMIATAKFQKSLKRAVATKPYTMKVRELVQELARSVGDVDHPLLRKVEAGSGSGREVVLVISSNRGLCGAYNGNVLRRGMQFYRSREAAGAKPELYSAGRKGATFFRFQRVPVIENLVITDTPAYSEVEPVVASLIEKFVSGEVDAVHVVYMNFISTGVQKPEVMTLLPLAGAMESAQHISNQIAEKENQMKAGAMDSVRSGALSPEKQGEHRTVTYDFSPSAAELLNELLPLTAKTAFFQSFLDATTSEHVARMVAMKSASDNAEQMAKDLTLQYNRARQSQITTELSEIMGGVEAMS